MGKVMTNSAFVKKLKNIANNYKTLYVMGCFGAPMTEANKRRYINNGAADSYNARPARKAMIEKATADTFGFDCVCLIKGVLWGWDGNKNSVYGGAKYAANGVPDIGADAMIKVCSGVSKDFSKLEIGEALWKSGHIGVYIGGGLAVECTPAWKNKVQITAVANMGAVSGYNARTWTKHGKLPYIEYEAGNPVEPPVEPDKPKKTIEQIAREVIAGKWGSAPERKKRLTDAGYDYEKVQAKVNEIMIDKVAREVIDGKWGNNPLRKIKLKKAGYDYAKVQKRVNELIRGV